MSFACAAAAAASAAFQLSGGTGGIESAPQRQPLLRSRLTLSAISATRRVLGRQSSFLQANGSRTGRQQARQSVNRQKQEMLMATIKITKRRERVAVG